MRSDLQANNMKPEFLDKTITQTLSTGSMLRWLQSGKETCLPVISCCAASCTRTLAWTQMKSCHSLRFHGEAAQQRERCAQKMPGKCSEASPISPEPPGQLCQSCQSSWLADCHLRWRSLLAAAVSAAWRLPLLRQAPGMSQAALAGSHRQPLPARPHWGTGPCTSPELGTRLVSQRHRVAPLAQ